MKREEARKRTIENILRYESEFLDCLYDDMNKAIEDRIFYCEMPVHLIKYEDSKFYLKQHLEDLGYTVNFDINEIYW